MNKKGNFAYKKLIGIMLVLVMLIYFIFFSRTLREHIQVTENKGALVSPPKRRGIGEMLGWKK